MLKLPVLDDRSFSDLMEEARALIPTLCPEWTDHNPADPGIVILELLAWLVEQVMFRVDEIPDENYWSFLSLLNGPNWQPPSDGDLTTAISNTIRELRTPFRAVTAADYEHLVLTQWPDSPQAKGPDGAKWTGWVDCIRCLAERNLEGQADTRDQPAPGHVSVLVLLRDQNGNPGDVETLKKLETFLDERRLLTTRLHVCSPFPRPFTLRGDVYLHPHANEDRVRTDVRAALTDAFCPWEPRTSQFGWPFGRNVYASDVYSLLENVVGVDFIENLRFGTADSSVLLRDYELPRLASIELTYYIRWGRGFKTLTDPKEEGRR